MISENGINNMAWFLGYVEDNRDPSGRIRVRAFGFHPPVTDGTVLTEDLPWAHVVRPPQQYSPYNLGDFVVGFFMDGIDAQHPVVIGTVNSAKYSLPAMTGFGQPGPVGGPQPLSSTQVPASDVEYILETLRNQESSGNYTARSTSSTASGAYQFTDGTWQGLTQQYGIGTDYESAADAPPEVQDAVATLYVEEILRENNNNVAIVPVVWYTGNPEGQMSSQALAANNGKTASMYQAEWLSKYNDVLAKYGVSPPGEAQVVTAFENPYLMPSQDAIDNFGNAPVPPQAGGIGIESTPLLTQVALTRSESLPSGTTINEPLPPGFGSYTDTMVLYASYTGSNITISRNSAGGYVDISHTTGSRVTLDSSGNITIKSVGKVLIGSEDSIEEISDGRKVSNYRGGYEVVVSGGKTNIVSVGDVSITTNGNMSLNAGGKITLNAGDSVDIAGSRIGAVARADAIDLVATGKMALHSQGAGISMVSAAGPMFLQAAGNIGIRGEGSIGLAGETIGVNGSGALKLKGSTIHLNSPGQDPEDIPDALAAILPNVTEPPPLGITPEDPVYAPNPSGAVSYGIDDTSLT